RYNFIRQVEADNERPVGVIADLQGPKIRINSFSNDKVNLIPGNKFNLDTETNFPGDESRISISSPEILDSLTEGVELLLDDGRIKLVVKRNHSSAVETEVLVGGVLSNQKGINIPGAILPISSLTKKDHEDLDFALNLGVDWIALSFVQRPEDIEDAKKLITGRAAILTKLEKPLAIKHLEKILELSDAIMVARGDLGVETPAEEVPGLQKKIIRHARSEGKPVIVATQMLESMVHSPTPTRAEASDVATAVFDGADAVMLSAETAVGQYPLEAVSIMNRIIRSAELDEYNKSLLNVNWEKTYRTDSDAITLAAKQVSHILNSKAIVTFTTTGSTTLRAARERPNVAVLGLTPDEQTARKIQLVWGVHPVKTTYFSDFNDVVATAIDVAKREIGAGGGDQLVITAGVPFGSPGTTNILRIVTVE
ncbi:MAG: pyruvate kinase, partial [Pseudomonadota bacterium]|nr:pyruvate kinase [Pseudomonadota bacterium]